jgi:hypothetical protein
MKNKKYHNVRTEKSYKNTQMQDRSFSWRATGTLKKSGGVKPVLLT